MATEVARLTAVLEADARKFERGLKDAEQDLKKLERSTGEVTAATGRLDRQIGNTGLTMRGVFAGAAGAALLQFGRESIQSFSELEQSIGGTEAVFGEFSSSIDQFAIDSAQNVGLAESAFRTATTNIGGQLKRMTGDVQFAAQQSTELVQIGADLAATYGGTTAQAVEALSSAFRGQAEPAERFNLDLRVSKVNAKAVELGLAETTSQVDDYARAQALLALITEQSADAQGQFARESDTVAGKLERANAKLENFKANVGAFVAGPFTEFVELGDDAITVLDGLTGLFGDASDEGFSFIEFAENAFPPTKLLTDGLSFLAGVFEDTTEESRELQGPIRSAAESFGQLGEEVEFSGAAMSRVQFEKAIRGYDDVGKAAKEAADKIRGFVNAQRAAVDPVIRAIESLRRYEEAVLANDAALAEFGEGTREAEEAGLRLLSAWGDLIADAETLADVTGVDIEEALRAVGGQAGLTQQQTQDLIDAFRELNGMKVVADIEARFVATGSVAARNALESGGAFSGGGSTTRTPSIQEMIRGGLQHGGFAHAGQPYLVGEAGPELFVPNQSGTVVPNISLTQNFQRVAGDNIEADISRGILLSGIGRFIESSPR